MTIGVAVYHTTVCLPGVGIVCLVTRCRSMDQAVSLRIRASSMTTEPTILLHREIGSISVKAATMPISIASIDM